MTHLVFFKENSAANLGLVKKIQDSNQPNCTSKNSIVIFHFWGMVVHPTCVTVFLQYLYLSLFCFFNSKLWLPLSPNGPDSSRHVQCHKPARYENRGATNRMEYELLYDLHCHSLAGLLVRTLILGEIKPATSREMAAMQNLGFCCLGKKHQRPDL